MATPPAAALLWGVSLCLAQDSIWKEQDPNAGYFISRHIEPTAAGREHSRDIALSEITSKKGYKFALAQVYSHRATLPCSLQIKGYHIGYVAWQVLYENCSKLLSGSLVEALSWRGGVCLRHKDERGARTTELISGIDPYRVQVGDREARIVFFSFPRASTDRKESRVELYAVHSVGNDTSNSEEWVPLYTELLPSLPFQDVTLYLRSDDWFALQEHFPIVNPFGEVGRAVPSESAYLRTRTIVCYGGRARPRCGVQRN